MIFQDLAVEITIKASGHPNILGLHQTTFQVTTETEVTKQGDCIVGIGSSHAAQTLPTWLKSHLKKQGWLRIILKVGNYVIEGKGQGHNEMTFEHPHDLVFRRSQYVCNRTISINTTITAALMPRDLIRLLQHPNQIINITLITD